MLDKRVDKISKVTKLSHMATERRLLSQAYTQQFKFIEHII